MKLKKLRSNIDLVRLSGVEALINSSTQQNAEIKQGETVLIVEAMKMQNEMKSPKDGIVKVIKFAEGATVNAGDVLAIIE